jgi:hypothetical protein
MKKLARGANMVSGILGLDRRITITGIITNIIGNS